MGLRAVLCFTEEKLERKPFEHDDDDVADNGDNADDDDIIADVGDDDVIADVGALLCKCNLARELPGDLTAAEKQFSANNSGL